MRGGGSGAGPAHGGVQRRLLGDEVHCGSGEHTLLPRARGGKSAGHGQVPERPARVRKPRRRRGWQRWRGGRGGGSREGVGDEGAAVLGQGGAVRGAHRGGVHACESHAPGRDDEGEGPPRPPAQHQALLPGRPGGLLRPPDGHGRGRAQEDGKRHLPREARVPPRARPPRQPGGPGPLQGEPEGLPRPV